MLQMCLYIHQLAFQDQLGSDIAGKIDCFGPRYVTGHRWSLYTTFYSEWNGFNTHIDTLFLPLMQEAIPPAMRAWAELSIKKPITIDQAFLCCIDLYKVKSKEIR